MSFWDWHLAMQEEAGGEWWIERRIGWPDRRRHAEPGWTRIAERRKGLPDRRMQVRERELAVC